MSIKGISVNYLRQRTTSSQLPTQIDIAFQVLPREMEEGSGCREPKSNSEGGEEQSAQYHQMIIAHLDDEDNKRIMSLPKEAEFLLSLEEPFRGGNNA